MKVQECGNHFTSTARSYTASGLSLLSFIAFWAGTRLGKIDKKLSKLALGTSAVSTAAFAALGYRLAISRSHQSTRENELLLEERNRKNEQEFLEYHRKRKEFLECVEKRLNRESPPVPPLLPDCSQQEVKEAAVEALLWRTRANLPPEFEIFWGGESVCMATEKIPGVLFKTLQGETDDRSQRDRTSYVKRAEKARKICEENQLHLLYIPQSKLLDGDKSVVVEE
ncbi:MAG: hypothetical protein JSR80_05905, partial [Verrucomicrobia bacterium]|nr:hypothetical protein [Verrucomicrobiota bacterium]